jgi:hypothetical protein
LIFAYFAAFLGRLSPHCQPLFYFLLFFFLEKKRILGNHPKLGDDSEQIKILNSSFAFAILS